MFCLLSLSCATDPSRDIDRLADRYRFDRIELTAAGFRHVLYTRLAGQPPGPVHVYIDGDGSPWIAERRISHDPTMRNPLALKLMAADRNASIYLGRPCYHGSAGAAGCTPDMWTTRRYSDAVVNSMASVLSELVRRHHIRQIILIGYSGGGTLAMLLAGRLQEVIAVVTVAGNLDTDGWTTRHGYTPLYGSLNPSKQPALPGQLVQIHLAGDADRVVPCELTRTALEAIRAPDESLIILPGFDHTCCWEQHWPEILRKHIATLHPDHAAE